MDIPLTTARALPSGVPVLYLPYLFTREHGVRATRQLASEIASTSAGAMPAAFGTADETTLKEAATREPGTDGASLALM